jgi:hypothetical protein
LLTITAPTKRTASLFVETKSGLEPTEVDYLSATVRPTVDQPVLVVAPFLSPRAQERLTAGGFGCADLTGNVRLSVPKAGLFIETSGAQQNPAPTIRENRSEAPRPVDSFERSLILDRQWIYASSPSARASIPGTRRGSSRC